MANDNTKKFLGIAGTQALVNEIKGKVTKVTSTDNAVVRFNGTGGSVQNSSVTIADTGSITIGGTWTDTSGNNPYLSMGGYAKLTGNTSGAFTFAPSNTPTFLATTTEFRPISSTANQVDLGSSQYRFRNIYAGTSLSVPTVNATSVVNTPSLKNSNTSTNLISVPDDVGTIALTKNTVNITGDQTIYNTKTFKQRPTLEVTRLPSDYQEIEYVESSGTAYINTGLPVHMNWKYKIVFQQNTTSTYRIWGAFSQQSYNGGFNASLTYASNNWMVRWETVSGQTRAVNLPIMDTRKHVLYIDQGNTYFDGVSYGISAGHDASAVSNCNAFLFTINPGETTPSGTMNGKVYSYQVWNDNDVLVQDLVPCIRKSDNTIGFYDLEGENFIQAVTGTFTAGQDVVDSNFLVFSDLSDVAISGDYNDLKNKPTITLDYNDLINKPTNHVTTDTEQTITGIKTIVGQTKIKGSAAAASADNSTNGFSFWKSTTTNFNKTTSDYLGLISPNDNGALGFYGRTALFFRPVITNGSVDTNYGVTMNSTGLFPGSASMPLGNSSNPWGNIYGNNVHIGSNVYLTGTTIKKVATLGNTTATYTYTLPTATGTLALVGDNNHTHNYLPLTGATIDDDFGITTGSDDNIDFTTGRDGNINLQTGTDGSIYLKTAGDGRVRIGRVNSTYYATLSTSDLTASRVFSFPNAAGTFATETWVDDNYQTALDTQTAYASKGTATKVPQITTNAWGQVTSITEVDITQPTVNNGVLKIKANGTSKGTFSANQSGNTEINITASDLGLASAMKFIGTSTTAITDGATTSPINISGAGSYTPNRGDIVLYGGKEYIWTETAWEQFGDEGSYALKTITISGSGALGGSGTLENNVTITHNELNTSGAKGTAAVYKTTLDKYGHVLSAAEATASDVGAVAKVSSTDNAIVRFNGTNGEIQDSVPKIDDSGNITSTKSIFLQTVGSSVSDTNASRLYFGTSPSSYYSYLASNTSGAFTMASKNGNFTFYPNTGTYNCIMTNSGSHLGRGDNNGGYAWGSLYTKGKVYKHKGGSNGFYEINWPSNDGTLALVGDNNHTHAYVPLAGGTMTGDLSLGNHDITNANSVSANAFTIGDSNSSTTFSKSDFTYFETIGDSYDWTYVLPHLTRFEDENGNANASIAILTSGKLEFNSDGSYDGSGTWFVEEGYNTAAYTVEGVYRSDFGQNQTIAQFPTTSNNDPDEVTYETVAYRSWVQNQGYITSSALNGLVHTTGNETIDGIKTFSKTIQAANGINLGNTNSIKPLVFNSSTSGGRYVNLYPTTNNSNSFTLYLPAADGTLATQEWVNNKGYITSSSLSNLVPYTGATGDLDIGSHSIISSDEDGLTLVSTNENEFNFRAKVSNSSAQAGFYLSTQLLSANQYVRLKIPTTAGTIATEEYVDSKQVQVLRFI